MTKEKLCMFCQNFINLNKDKHVLLGTYDGSEVMDESYFHFQCFNSWYNSRVKLKAENTLKDATKKIKGMMGGIIQQVRRNSGGEQVIDFSNEIPDMEKETKIF